MHLKLKSTAIMLHQQAFILMLVGSVICSFFLVGSLRAQPARAHLEVVHEAYFPSQRSAIPLEVILKDPPTPIQEIMPPQYESDLQWIPGYWMWSAGRNDFVWVSGVWRRPPPGQIWIPGDWKRFPQGWVYQRGFWNNTGFFYLTYLPIPPPDAIQEPLINPLHVDSFWNPGYWAYLPELGEYIWLSGQWERLDPRWILVPAHYEWREQGYIFVPAFWDWPLEGRGQAFSAPYVLPEDREETLAQPLEVLDPLLIVEQLLPYYPDYLYFYAHYLYFHPDIWNLFPLIPPWWKWRNWWALNWRQQWALWWWYTHPNYPQPNWVSPLISEQLSPPTLDLLAATRRLIPPFIVTPLGVISPTQILDSLSLLVPNPSGQIYPFISTDPLWYARWFRTIKTTWSSPIHPLKPSGRIPLVDFLRKSSTIGPQPIFKNSVDDMRALSSMKYRFSSQQMQKLRQRFQIATSPPKPSATMLQRSVPFSKLPIQAQQKGYLYPTQIQQKQYHDHWLQPSSADLQQAVQRQRRIQRHLLDEAYPTKN